MKLVFDSTIASSFEGACRIFNKHDYGPSPQYMNSIGYSALQKFFDLDSRTAYYIFDPSHYEMGMATPKQVAKRIRQVIKEGC